MGVINMLLKILSSGIGIAVPVLIIRVLHIKNRGYPCYLHLEDSARAFLMEGCASTIM